MLHAVAAALEAEAKARFPSQIYFLLLCTPANEEWHCAGRRQSSLYPSFSADNLSIYTAQRDLWLCPQMHPNVNFHVVVEREHLSGLCGTNSSVGCTAALPFLRQT